MAVLNLCSEDDVTAIRSMEPSTRLTRQIEAASRWIQHTKLRRDFTAGTGLEELTRYGGERAYYVQRPPVRSLTSIEFRLTDGSWQTQTYVSGNEPVVDYDLVTLQEQKDRTVGKIEFRDRTWPRGPGEARITYNGGLWSATSEVAQDLRYATALVVVFALNQDIRGGPGITARSIVETGEIITFGDRAAQEEVEEILDGWRIG